MGATTLIDETNPSEPQGNQKDDRLIHVKVITTAKDLNEKFERQEPLQAVFSKALALVGGEGQPDQFTLEYNDQPLTMLDRSLGEYADEFGWSKQVELELVPSPVVV